MLRWGPHRAGPGGVRFALWAPALASVDLEIEARAPLAMLAGGDGWFSVEAEAAAGSRYRFVLPDGLAVPDPASHAQSGGVHGWSVITDAGAHVWNCPDWRGRPWEEAIIQELHPGVAGGFCALAEDLERIAGLGITAVELMPIGAFAGTRNWGYDGVLPFAPAEAYGTPDDLMALIDRAHGLGLMVLLDVVYNHFGPDGNYLGAYAPDFFDPEVDTPWGGAVAVERPEVAAYFLQNALMWLEDYRFDGLRLDAVHAIGNNAFLDWLARGIRCSIGADRHIHLILENEHNDSARLVSGLYDAQWNDDFHNVLHVLLTGETSGYYADFTDRPAERLARCLAEGFIYQGEPSPNQGGHARGSPSAQLAPSAFVSFLQNHDQIGNRAFGERLTVLTDPARLRAATALLLLCPQIPLIFAGDEVGSQTPFLFFTDFSDELADAVREGRRGEFAQFGAFSDAAARARIPDPNDPLTFERSRPHPGPDADRWQAFYRELIALRRETIVPRLRGICVECSEVLGARAVGARWRMSDGARLAVAINLGDEAVSFPASPDAAIFTIGDPGAPASFAAWLTPA